MEENKTFTNFSVIENYGEVITDKNYMTWSNKISEIGKMLGGWIKTCQNV